MPASWSWSGRVSVVRRVCALPSSSLGGSGAVSQYHANGEISTERGQPAADTAPRQAGKRRDGQELAHSFVPPRVVEECLNITCWVRTSFLATHVRDPLKVELAPGNNACTYVGLMLMLLLDYSTWPCLGPS